LTVFELVASGKLASWTFPITFQKGHCAGEWQQRRSRWTLWLSCRMTGTGKGAAIRVIDRRTLVNVDAQRSTIAAAVVAERLHLERVFASD
jgi:hypothetical protein